MVQTSTLVAFVALFLQVGCVFSLDLASCNASSGFDWSYNSLDQDPCAVATFLGGVCNGGEYEIPAINSTEFYNGPSSSTQTDCRCSTVFYSLLMACGECQEASTITWTGYSANCSIVYDQVFPESIPSGTVVPHWAYLDVVTSNNFDATNAELAGDSPESSAAVTATASSTPSSPMSASTAGSSTSANTGNSSSSSKDNTGAIAGGVVGGVVGLAIVAAVLFWLLRKRTPNRSPTLGILDDRAMINSDMTGTTNAPTVLSYVPAQQRIYDPSDPSTFPTNIPSPTTTHYPYGSSINDSIYHHSSNPSNGQQTYPGHAEI